MIANKIKKQYPNNKVEIEEVDEWVYVNIFKNAVEPEPKNTVPVDEYMAKLEECMYG